MGATQGGYWDLNLGPLLEPGVVMDVYNLRTGEVETGGSPKLADQLI